MGPDICGKSFSVSDVMKSANLIYSLHSIYELELNKTYLSREEKEYLILFLKQCKSGVIALFSLSFSLDSNFWFIFSAPFHQRLQIPSITNYHTISVLILLLKK